jgi:HlyD family secretion protein
MVTECLDPLPADAGGAPSDRELLDHFLSAGSEEAFTLLVRRHGGIVYRVCERILQDRHDAEDAFQATFLILTRKAAEIRELDVLSSWLYGVATRVAVRVKSKRGRCRAREIDSTSLRGATAEAGKLLGDETNVNALEGLLGPASRSEDPRRSADRAEQFAVVAEELGRLPEKHRAPLILCYLQGKKNNEAAKLLGLPLGTFKSRLTKAREILRGRLAWSPPPRRPPCLPKTWQMPPCRAPFWKAALPRGGRRPLRCHRASRCWFKRRSVP